MRTTALTAEERMRRLKRDQEAYRRRSLMRRSHPRFRRDLTVVPHVFLLPGRTFMATLQQPAEPVLHALQDRAVWTLDTAARLASGRGFLTSPDLTGYLSDDSLRWAIDQQLISAPQSSGLSVEPLFRRPPMLIVHLLNEMPPFLELGSGDRVVPWSRLVQDILGTLGWRPDLLTRLEDDYPRAASEERDRDPVSALASPPGGRHA
jgi:hypothetical protein